MKIIKKKRTSEQDIHNHPKEHPQKNRISSIHEIKGKGSTKKSLLVLILIAIIAITAVGLVVLMNKKPQIFTPSVTTKNETKESPLEAPLPQIFSSRSENPHLARGKQSFARKYYTDAITEFNEVVESDAQDKDKAIALLYLGLIQQERDDQDSAIELFNRALIYDKSNPEIYQNLAVAYRKKNDSEKALDYAKKALDADKNNINTRVLLGNIYFELGLYKNAIEEYQAILNKKGNEPAVMYNLAIALMKTGSEFEAVEYLKKAASEDKMGEAGFRSLSRLGIYFLERKNYSLAEEYLLRARSIRPSDPILRYNLAIAYINQDKKKEAIEELNKSSELSGMDAEAHENIAEAYYSMGEYRLSLKSFERLQSIRIRNVRALSRIGDIHYKLGELDLALQAYRRITEIEGATENARTAYLNMGNILDDAGRYNEAIDAYKKALAINPKDHTAYYNLGQTYRNANRGELAIQAWKEASSLKTDDPAPRMAIADYYLQQGFYDLAEKEYRAVYEGWPGNQEAHFKLGTIYHKTGRASDAISAYEQVIKLADNNELGRKALINIALLRADTDSSEESLKTSEENIQKALLIKPGSADALNALGLIYSKRLMFEKAIETFHQVIRASQDSRQISEAYNNIGMNYYKLREYKKSLQAFTRGIEEDPTNEKIRINRKVAMEAYENLIKGSRP